MLFDSDAVTTLLAVLSDKWGSAGVGELLVLRMVDGDLGNVGVPSGSRSDFNAATTVFAGFRRDGMARSPVLGKRRCSE